MGEEEEGEGLVVVMVRWRAWMGPVIRVCWVPGGGAGMLGTAPASGADLPVPSGAAAGRFARRVQNGISASTPTRSSSRIKSMRQYIGTGTARPASVDSPRRNLPVLRLVVLVASVVVATVVVVVLVAEKKGQWEVSLKMR